MSTFIDRRFLFLLSHSPSSSHLHLSGPTALLLSSGGIVVEYQPCLSTCVPLLYLFLSFSIALQNRAPTLLALT